MAELPASGKLQLSKTEFAALVKEYRSIGQAMLAHYRRYATRIEEIPDGYEVTYTMP